MSITESESRYIEDTKEQHDNASGYMKDIESQRSEFDLNESSDKFIKKYDSTFRRLAK